MADADFGTFDTDFGTFDVDLFNMLSELDLPLVLNEVTGLENVDAIHTGKETKSETKSEPETGSLSRFKPKTEEEVKHIEDKNHAAETKKNTQWGLKIVQDWHLSVHGDVVDLATVEEERLNNLLRKFYCEVAPQEKKIKSAELQLKVYHKNTMKNIRAALNRHLSDIGMT
ncbi:uncharacterized protein LOC128221624 [Mya arenaria]|uniref:uncharacterized protein LOC128221624 n=1 Tax=Mya arenaria TaxID=6604 RepID=UPI0022E8258B|nr:uncharacterized protein LOC128221624 [Mya arenaria]